MGGIVVVFLGYVVYSYFKTLVEDVRKNSEDILALKEKIQYMNDIHLLDKRISLLEGRKKGQIDPRVVFAVIIVLLLLLFLRSVGILQF